MILPMPFWTWGSPVNFFAVNPHYFTFIYDGDDYRIDLTEDTFDGDFEHLFKELGLLCLEYNHGEG